MYGTRSVPTTMQVAFSVALSELRPITTHNNPLCYLFTRCPLCPQDQLSLQHQQYLLTFESIYAIPPVVLSILLERRYVPFCPQGLLQDFIGATWQ